MLVGTAMTGTLDQAGDDARQRAFHAGDDDDDARGGEPRALAEQTVEAGDADVVQAVDVVAHQLGRARRFFGDRQVGRAGRGDQDRALARARCRCWRKVMSARIGVIRRRRARRARTASYAAAVARVTSSV